MRVAFVCTGNTCRSPMAEVVMREKARAAGLNDLTVLSCGLQVVPMSTMSENSKKALLFKGYSVSDRVAVQASKEQLKGADLIVCMTPMHKYYVKDYGKAVTVSEITGGRDVPDPYGSDQQKYDECLCEIENMCDVLINKIKDGVYHNDTYGGLR